MEHLPHFIDKALFSRAGFSLTWKNICSAQFSTFCHITATECTNFVVSVCSWTNTKQHIIEKFMKVSSFLFVFYKQSNEKTWFAFVFGPVYSNTSK